MKSVYSIRTAILCFIALAICASPLAAQETRNVSVSNFSGVSVGAGIELHISQGNSESAKIVAESDVMDQVKIEKSGNDLKIGWKDSWSMNKMFKNKSAKVYVTYKKLNSISASSGSSLRTDNTLKTDHLSASVSSGANMDANVVCNELQLSTSSGADASLTGTATNMEVSSSSGSNVNAVNLTTQYAKASTSSGADIKINVSKALEAHTSSGGNITYKGAADVKDTSSRRNSGVSRIN